MTARAPASAFDLLAWPAVAAARAELAEAEAARLVALKRWRLSPHGQRHDRLRAYQEATQRALSAAQAYVELGGQLPCRP